MKSIFNAKPVTLVLLSLLICFATATSARAQDPKIQMGQIDRFADKAERVIDVTVDESLIKLAISFLNPKRSPDEAKLREILSGLKGVYVKRLEFEKDNEYALPDIQSIRSQLDAPGWSRIAKVTSKRAGNFDVVIMSEGSVIKGLAVFAAEPKALTLVNVIGQIDLSKFAELEGKFGIPHFDFEQIPGVTVKENIKDKKPEPDKQNNQDKKPEPEKRN
jgi:uncharacterized protein DUF4252